MRVLLGSVSSATEHVQQDGNEGVQFLDPPPPAAEESPAWVPPPGRAVAVASLVWNSGTICLLSAAFLFAVAASLVKAVPPSISIFEIVVLRSAVTCSFSLLASRAAKVRPLFGQMRHWPLLAMRGLAGAAAMTLFYLTLRILTLADCVALLYVNPVFCAVLGWAVLKERFSWRTVAGAQPQHQWTHSRLVGVLLGLAGALMASLAYVMIRVIGKREPSLCIAFWFHTTALVTSAVPLVLGVPQAAVLPVAWSWLYLLAVGICSFGAQLLLNRGFQLHRAALASTLSCSQLLWANLLGAAFFHEHINLVGTTGAGLIVAGVLAVAADKKPADDGEQQDSEGLPLLKAKSSFRLEEGAADEGSIGTAAVRHIQMQPLPTEGHLRGVAR